MTRALTASVLASLLLAAGGPGPAPAAPPGPPVPPVQPTPPPGQAPDLYVILVADTDDDGIGGSCFLDMQKVRGLFEGDAPKSRRTTVRLFAGRRTFPKFDPKYRGPDNFNQAAIRQYVQQIPLGPNTGVLFYFSGHGDYTTKDGHRMLIPGENNGRLANEDVFRLVAARDLPVRMIAVISDSCGPNVAPVPEVFPQMDAMPAPPMLNRVPDVLDDLFYKPAPAGPKAPAPLLDINSCSEGELAWGREDQGGFFTSALVARIYANGLGSRIYQDDRPGRSGQKDGRLTWHEILPGVILDTDQDFQKVAGGRRLDGPDGKPQKAQTPQAFRLPDPGPDHLPRYTIGTETRNAAAGTGVEVVKVVPGGPADRAGLRPGDVVRRVNGRSVRNAQDFSCQVQFPGNPAGRPGPVRELRLAVERGGAGVELAVVPNTN